MSLKNTIESDYLSAYKAKDEPIISALRMVRSSIKNFEINERKDATEDDVLRILKKEAKQRQDSISEYDKAGRSDLSEKEKVDLDIISRYLPKQMPKEELEKIVAKVIAEVGATSMADMSKIMPEVIKRTAGAADNSEIAQIVRAKLS